GMRTKLLGMFGAFVVLAANCLGQKVPVMIQRSFLTDDQAAAKFANSLSDEIQLSGKFFESGNLANPVRVPTNGVRIVVRPMPVKLLDGNELGSAIFVEADRPSAKDPGYYKGVTEQTWMIPKDGSVADQTRRFVAEVDRVLDH